LINLLFSGTAEKNSRALALKVFNHNYKQQFIS